MQKIIPYLWLNEQAEEAVAFYASIFKNSKIVNTARYDEEGASVSGRQKGSVMTITYLLEDQEFIALNGGPIFSFSPAISFFVGCKTPQEVDFLWGKLSKGGKVLMELGKYPFAEKYGWVEDKFGVSWQLYLGGFTQKITPCLMFVGEQQGKAEQAMNFYVSLFNGSRITLIERYGKGEGEVKAEGTVKHARFMLEGQEFIAMDGGVAHSFTFTPAISFLVNCLTQQEVDGFWEKLTKSGEEQACGWLKDKYGLSWQIIPTILDELLQDKDPAKAKRVMMAMLKMKKIDIKALKQAYEQG